MGVQFMAIPLLITWNKFIAFVGSTRVEYKSPCYLYELLTRNFSCNAVLCD